MQLVLPLIDEHKPKCYLCHELFEDMDSLKKHQDSKHKEFFDKLFKVYPWLSKVDQLKQIYYVLFENYTFNDLKCSVKDCNNLKKFHAGKFSLCCKNHKNEAKIFQYQKVSEIVKNRDEKTKKNIVRVTCVGFKTFLNIYYSIPRATSLSRSLNNFPEGDLGNP